MAELIPTPPILVAPRSEMQVRDALKERLADSWQALHSVGWLSPKGKQHDGEADFVLVHPSIGLIVIEVKGGREIRIHRGSWQSVDHRGNRHPIKDPYRQALQSKHELLAWLKRRISYPGYLPAAHCVVFPGATNVPELGAHAPKALTVDRTDLNADLTFRMRAISDACGQRPLRTPLTKKQVDEVVSLLMPTRTIKMPVKSLSDDAETRLANLTQQQYHVLSLLRHQRQAVITGPAGTGKTILAREKARELDRSGFRVALFVFGDFLATELREQLSGTAVQVFAQMHIRTILNDSYNLGMSSREVVAGPTREAVEHYVASIGQQEPLFDAVIVDEAQLIVEETWELLRSATADDAPSYFFADEYQGWRARPKASWYESGGPHFELTLNCRNSRQIGTVAASVRRDDSELPSISGPEVQFIDQEVSAAEVANQVEDLLSEGFLPEEVLIIAFEKDFSDEEYGVVAASMPSNPSQYAKATFGDVDRIAEALDAAGIRVADSTIDLLGSSQARLGRDGVRLCFASFAVGLESSAVIVAHRIPQRGMDDSGDRDFYTSVTRARSVLRIIGDIAALAHRYERPAWLHGGKESPALS